RRAISIAPRMARRLIFFRTTNDHYADANVPSEVPTARKPPFWYRPIQVTAPSRPLSPFSQAALLSALVDAQCCFGSGSRHSLAIATVRLGPTDETFGLAQFAVSFDHLVGA